MPVVAVILLAALWIACARFIRRPGAESKREQAMRVLGGVVERVRDAPAEPHIQPEPDPSFVRIVEESAVQPQPLDAVRPGKPMTRRSRSMTPSAIAARRARADRRARAGLEAPTPDPRPTIVLRVRPHEDTEGGEVPREPVLTESAAVGLFVAPLHAAHAQLRRLVTVRHAVVAATVVAAVGLVVVTTEAGNGTNSTAVATNRATTTTVAAPPPSTPPAPVTPIQPVSKDSSTAVITTAASFRIGVTATSACWIRVTNDATHAVVLEATLQPGQHQDIDASAPTSLRIGNPPAVTLAVDDVPVQFDHVAAQPLDVQFTGGAAPQS